MAAADTLDLFEDASRSPRSRGKKRKEKKDTLLASPVLVDGVANVHNGRHFNFKTSRIFIR